MSNFICPTCGIMNIDCGKAGYKTDREIELNPKVRAFMEIFDKLEKMPKEEKNKTR